MTRLAAPRVQRGATRLLQAAIAAMLAVGVATANLAVVVNAALSLAATFLPAAVARDLRTNPPAWLTLFVAFALFLHTLGMLGLYGDVWWYDHLTHTLSATLVAGVGYVAVRALADHDDRVVLPPEFTVVLVLLATLALGVVWELLEFAARGAAALVGAEPVLVQYGLDDTLADLLFDAVGATVAAALGPGSVGGLVDAVRARLDERGGDGDRGPGLDALVRRDPANARRSWLVLAGLVAAGAASLSTGLSFPRSRLAASSRSRWCPRSPSATAGRCSRGDCSRSRRSPRRRRRSPGRGSRPPRSPTSPWRPSRSSSPSNSTRSRRSR
ncbi:hypothetical protein [Halosegnis marinus]|uniref:hypothetical protein n=1 Tax=Halosegnis marinus TaxID=3034023 RepID=UPI0036081B08